MLKVLLDARKLGDGGIGIYLENLIAGYLPLVEKRELALSLIVDPKRKEKREIANFLSGISSEVQIICDGAKSYSIDEYLLMPLRLRSVLRETDIYHSPHYIMPFFIRCKRVATIHDIIHCTFPDTWLHKQLGRRLIQSAISRADMVITVSNHSKQQLGRNFRVEEGKLSVIANGLRSGIRAVSSDLSSATVKSLGINGPFALFVGSDRPHKGLHSLLVALSILKHSLEQEDKEPLRLVVVGRAGEQIRHEAKALGLEKEVIFLSDQEIELLNTLYSAAIMTVIASLEEGFGLVALESLAVGCPLVSTPLPSVMEIAQDAAFFAEGFSPKHLFYAMKELLQSKQALVDAKVTKGREQAKRFSIESAAEQTFALYRGLQDKSGL